MTIALALSILGWAGTVIAFLVYLSRREDAHSREITKLLVHVQAPSQAVAERQLEDRPDHPPVRPVSPEDDEGFRKLKEEREGAVS